MPFNVCIAGCGDVGTRIAHKLKNAKTNENSILALVRSDQSRQALEADGFRAQSIDFDQMVQISKKQKNSNYEHIQDLYYLVPPQKTGRTDLRTNAFLQYLQLNGFTKKQVLKPGQTSVPPRRIVLISTTGVYGDCDGEVVTEKTVINPTTERSQRRADMEQQWVHFAQNHEILLSILRVPGIYSFSRLPRARLATNTPIVNPDECGYTNRIHADDLAMICQIVMEQQTQSDIYNVSDGRPGKLSQYLIDVAEFLKLTPPPIIRLAEGHDKISTGMMSYLTESRKIDNTKLLKQFNMKLKYIDYREGIKY